MASIFRSLIETEVDRLFSEIDAKHGEMCSNPVTLAGFIWGVDPIATQKKFETVAILAREWFAVHGPRGAPPLPLHASDRDHYRSARGLKGVVGFYARSLSGQNYDVLKHPSFDVFARGLMAVAVESGLWGLEKDETLIKRFPPLPLPGMTPSGYWDREEYEKTRASYYRHLRTAA